MLVVGRCCFLVVVFVVLVAGVVLVVFVVYGCRVFCRRCHYCFRCHFCCEVECPVLFTDVLIIAHDCGLMVVALISIVYHSIMFDDCS